MAHVADETGNQASRILKIRPAFRIVAIQSGESLFGPLDIALARQNMVGPMPVAGKVNSLAGRENAGLAIQGQSQLTVKICTHFRQAVPEFPFVIVQDHKIIHVADIIMDAQILLDKMIQAVKIGIGEQLARKRTKGQAARALYAAAFLDQSADTL